MSQSPETAGGNKDDYIYGWMAMSESIAAGGSFSGHEQNCCFLNTGSRRFADVSAVTGIDFADDGRTVCVADWDHDGALDLWLGNRTGPRIRLMHNGSPSDNHFVAVLLTGRDCNRDAIGARLELYLKGEPTPLLRTLHAGQGFLSQSTKWVHFGVSSDDEIDRLVVHWPGGKQETFSEVASDQHYRATQGEGRLIGWQRPPSDRLVTQDTATATQRASSGSHPGRAAAGYRVVLAGRLPMPNLRYDTRSGASDPITFGEGYTLINLWSATCAPCLVELKDFAENRSRLEDARVNILPLNVDDESDHDRARDAMARLDWSAEWGFASDELVFSLDILQRMVVSQRKQMPVPTSFLIDPDRRLIAVYKGVVGVDQILDDVAGAVSPVHPASIPFAGRWIEEPTSFTATTMNAIFEFLNAGYPDAARDILMRVDTRSLDAVSPALLDSLVTAHVNLAAQLDDQQAAMTILQRAVKIHPGAARAHFALGQKLKTRKQSREAVAHFKQAVKAQPEFAEAQLELGIAYIGLAQAEPALEHLRAAAKLRSEWIAPKNLLARVLSTHPDPRIRDSEEAIRLSKLTVRLSGGKHAQSWETLSLSLASGGQRKQAINAAKHGVKAAQKSGEPQIALRIQAHLRRLLSTSE